MTVEFEECIKDSPRFRCARDPRPFVVSWVTAPSGSPGLRVGAGWGVGVLSCPARERDGSGMTPPRTKPAAPGRGPKQKMPLVVTPLGG